MCGIIGIISPDNQLLRTTAASLLHESQIRGKHATGISYILHGRHITEKAPIPAETFIKNTFPKDLGNVMIGHTRYSTSDIEYNQPLRQDDISLVHNGVITQSAFEEWEAKFGYKDFKTRNDSEILLKRIAEKKEMDSWLDFEDSSIAAGAILRKELFCFRNGQRPLYIFYSKEVMGFASTENIIKRALGKTAEIYKTKPFEIYNFYISNNQIKCAAIETKHETTELQLDTIRGNSYLTDGCIKA